MLCYVMLCYVMLWVEGSAPLAPPGDSAAAEPQLTDKLDGRGNSRPVAGVHQVRGKRAQGQRAEG